MSSLVGGVGGAIIGGGLIGGLGSLFGGIFGGNGAAQAAQYQAQAAEQATALQSREFDTEQANQKPWLDAGKSALLGMSNMNNAGAQFTQKDFLNNQDPAYQFDLQQGQQALQRSAAAQGSLMSGGTLKDLTTYSQGQASNEYNNAYNRFMNTQNTQYNRLASIAGLGQTATGQLNQAGMNSSTNIGNIGMSNANAQGAASIAQGNIWGGALSGLGKGAGNAAIGMSLYNQSSTTAQPFSPNGMQASGGLSNLTNQQSSAGLEG